MNLRRRVWLPPDGDPRLIRFQEDWAAALGRPGESAVPPHLHLASTRREPAGPVRTGAWKWKKAEPVLEAWDDGGLAGVFRFGLVRFPGPGDPLPEPPRLSWTKGRTAVLELSRPPGIPAFLWSWTDLKGWKAAPPRG